MYAAVSLFCRTALCFVKVSPNVLLPSERTREGLTPACRLLWLKRTAVSLKLFFLKKDKCTLQSSALWTCLVPVSTFQSHCCKDKQFLLKHKVAQRHTTFCFTLRPPEEVLALSCANMSCCAFAKTTWWCCFNAVGCFKLQFYGAFQCLHVCVCRTGTPFLSVSPVP